MSTSFKQLKRDRKSNVDKLTSELSKLDSPQASNNNKDDRFWQPEVDKMGNGYAVIRFLPAPTGEDVPFVRIWDHGFQGPGGWYIEKSLTTLGEKDPVSEYNSKLWNSGVDSNKDVVRKQKRRLYFVSNILVVKDPAHPENEGQVRLYRYGKKIFDKVNDLMNPEFEDETPINPFDFWDGADFKLKIRKVEGYRNYDKSEFADPTEILDGDDDKLEELWKKQFSLQAFIAPDQFKSYDELKARLDMVLANKTVDPEPETVDTIEETMATSTPEAEAKPIAEDEDDTLSFFEKLAEED